MSASRLHELHPVHQLIQRLGRDPALQQRLKDERQAVFDEFGISKKEAEALAEGSHEALASIDVHPVLRMHWLMMSNPEAASQMSISEYIPKFERGAAGG